MSDDKPKHAGGRPRKRPEDKAPQKSGATKRREAHEREEEALVIEATANKISGITLPEVEDTIRKVMKAAGRAPRDPIQQIMWITDLAARATFAAYSTLSPALWKWARGLAEQAKAMGMLGNKAKYESEIKRLHDLLEGAKRSNNSSAETRKCSDFIRPPTARGSGKARGPRPIP